MSDMNGIPTIEKQPIINNVPTEKGSFSVELPSNTIETPAPVYETQTVTQVLPQTSVDVTSTVIANDKPYEVSVGYPIDATNDNLASSVLLSHIKEELPVD